MDYKSNIFNIHSELDCFYQLIEGVELGMLNNLIQLIMKNKALIAYEELSQKECYNLLQNKNIDDSYKKMFLDLAFQ